MERLARDGVPPRALVCIKLRGCLVLLALQILDSVLEQVHLLVVLGVQPHLDDAIARLQLLEIESDSFLVSPRGLFLLGITLHELVDLDALEGSHLPDVLLESCEAAAHSDHYLVRLYHQNTCQGADHVLALIRLRSLFQFDDRQECDQNHLQFGLAHDSQVLELFDDGPLWALAGLLSHLVEQLLLLFEVAGIIDADHLLFDDLRADHFDIGENVIQPLFKLVYILLV